MGIGSFLSNLGGKIKGFIGRAGSAIGNTFSRVKDWAINKGHRAMDFAENTVAPYIRNLGPTVSKWVGE